MKYYTYYFEDGYMIGGCRLNKNELALFESVHGICYRRLAD